MKKNAISKIMYGEGGKRFFQLDDDSQKTLDKFCEQDKALRKKLETDDELSNAYKNAIETFNELCAAQAETFYKEGFAFGVMLGLEIAKFDK